MKRDMYPAAVCAAALSVRHAASRRASCSGFTLLEVLVALSLLAIAVTAIFQLFGANLRAISLSEDYIAASVNAESRMRELMDNDGLDEGSWSETNDRGYRIDVMVSDALKQRTELLPVKLLDIVVTVKWRKGVREKAMTLRTLKMINRKV